MQSSTVACQPNTRYSGDAAAQLHTGNPTAFANTPASPFHGQTLQSARTPNIPPTQPLLPYSRGNVGCASKKAEAHPTLVEKNGGLGPCYEAIARPGKGHGPAAGLNVDVSPRALAEVLEAEDEDEPPLRPKRFQMPMQQQQPLRQA